VAVPLQGADLGPSVDGAAAAFQGVEGALAVGFQRAAPPWVPSVLAHLRLAPVCVFQNLMQRSAVPPPVASRLLCRKKGF
jgi:hypothetical protein